MCKTLPIEVRNIQITSISNKIALSNNLAQISKIAVISIQFS